MIKERQRTRTLKDTMLPSFWFASPAVIVYTILFALPVLIAFSLSVTNWNGLSFSPDKLQFLGMENYKRMLTDKDLVSSVWVTLKITLVVSLTANIGGLAIALMLKNSNRLSNAVRSIFFIPYVMSTVAIAFIWMAILSYNGLLNNLLTSLGLDKLSLFSNGKSALACVCVIEIWRTIGFYMVLYIAALQGVPSSLQEACLLDGGGKWALFWRVQLPLIAPQMITGFLMSFTMEMRLYDLVYILTDGGPGVATRTIAYSIVVQGFTNWRMGYACAIAVGLSLIVVVISTVLRRMQKAVEVEL